MCLFLKLFFFFFFFFFCSFTTGGQDSTLCYSSVPPSPDLSPVRQRLLSFVQIIKLCSRTDYQWLSVVNHRYHFMFIHVICFSPLFPYFIKLKSTFGFLATVLLIQLAMVVLSGKTPIRRDLFSPPMLWLFQTSNKTIMTVLK